MIELSWAWSADSTGKGSAVKSKLWLKNNRESMKKAWFWSCHQVPISVIRSLPVTKKSANFVVGNKIYDIFQRQIWLWNWFFFLSLQRNLSLESNFVAQRQVLAATKVYETPPPPRSPQHLLGTYCVNMCYLHALAELFTIKKCNTFYNT